MSISLCGMGAGSGGMDAGRGGMGAGADCELKYWYWLGALAGVSARCAKLLLERFGNPYEVFRQPGEVLDGLDGVGRGAALRLRNPAARVGLDERTLAVTERGIELVTLEDPRYPAHIKEIHDPPPLLFMRGQCPARSADRPVAIVGTRHPSAYGVSVARSIAAGLAAYGFTVVSGLAMGIDAAAHAATVEAGGKTVAFLGCGVERAYPVSNRRLMDEVIAHGAVYSEYPPGTEAFSANFPQRNRLISGMSRGIVVVEAGERSGALITAGFAGEQGRDVFAVPGNVTSPQSRGSNALIRDGAALVTSAEDIVSLLNPYFDAADTAGEGCAVTAANTADVTAAVTTASTAELGEDERKVARLLRDRGPHELDGIGLLCGLSAAAAGSAAVTLELKGVVRRDAAGFYEYL